MCEYSGKLVAWMDNELLETEAVVVERHVQNCAVCRRQLARYERVSGDFSAYCHAMAAPRERRPSKRRIAVSIAAAAAVIGAALFLTFLRGHNPAKAFPHQGSTPLLAVTTAENASEVKSVQTPDTRAPRTRRARTTPAAVESAFSVADSRQRGDAGAVAVGLSVEIAIPAEAILPPGAVPEGTVFIGSFSIGADGSAQQLQIGPQLTGFERGIQ